MSDEGFKLTPAQLRATDVLISDAMYPALGGGSRCVAGDTVLDGQVETIAQLAARGAPVRVLTSHGWQMAEAPFRKGSAELLEVTTETGRRVEVTTDHRFWDGGQWVYARDLIPGVSLVACRSFEPYLQESSLGHVLSGFVEGVRRLKKRLSGWMDRYSGYPHQCDQQPPQLAGNDQACRALLSGESVHNRPNQSQRDHALRLLGLNTHTDHPSALVGGDNLSGLWSYHPSTSDGSPLSDRASRSSAPVSWRISEWFPGLFGKDQRSRLLSDRLQSVLSRTRSSLHRFFPFAYLDAPCDDTPVVTGYDMEKVSTVTRTSMKDYYTLHVPGTEQYFANGILHHNSGKTFLLVRAVVIRALKAPDSRHVIFRFRFNSVKNYIYNDTLPKVLQLCFPQLPPLDAMTNKTDWYVELPNGSQIWLGGLDDKERVEKILGGEYATIYFNECSQIPYHSVVTALTRLAQKTKNLKLKAFYDFNPPSKKHWTYLLFVERKEPLTKRPLARPEDYGFYLINPADNADNLDPAYIRMLEGLPEKARMRFLLGKFADETDGSLWSEDVLQTTRRVDDLPQWLRVVIAVDPSGTSGPEDTRSDEVGIIVGALGTDGHGYILEDLSGKYKPEVWADIVNEGYDRNAGDRVVGEVNFGGDMVRAVLQAKNPNLPYKEVRASRGKVVRAEPISALYDQGKIHHVGFFPELEDQMCSMLTSGYQGLKSPDRVDALVWLLTELFPGITAKAEDTNWRPPNVRIPERSARRYERKY